MLSPRHANHRLHIVTQSVKIMAIKKHHTSHDNNGYYKYRH